MNPGDDILKYFSEMSDAQRQAFEKSIEDNTSAMDDLAMLKDIWDEAGHLHTLQTIDVEAAWDKVEQEIDPDVATRRFILWPYISVAASIALFVMSGLYFLNRDPSYFVEVTTEADEYKEITLADESIVVLAPDSYLKYPKQFDDPDERRIYLRGDAGIEVTGDSSWPFVTQNFGAGILAIGTEYTIQSDSSAVRQESILENVGGVMQIYSRRDTSIKQKLKKKGEKAVFDGDSIKFIPIDPPPPPDTLSRPISGVSFINLMQDKFQRRFVTTKNMPHDENVIFMVNPDQDLFSIMAQLDTIADIDYDIVGNTVYLFKLLDKKED